MKIVNVLILLTLFSVLGISDSHAEECVKKFDTKWGDSCNSKDSFSVRLINTCMHNADVRVCLKRKNGRWKCYVESDVRPNEIIG